MVAEQGTDLWVYGMSSGIILLLYSFIRIIVLGFSPGPISYVVSGSCEYVSLQCQVSVSPIHGLGPKSNKKKVVSYSHNFYATNHQYVFHAGHCCRPQGFVAGR